MQCPPLTRVMYPWCTAALVAAALATSACNDETLGDALCFGSTCAFGGADGGALNGADSGLPGYDGSTPPGWGSSTNLPCDVKEVVYEHCLACHSDPPVGTYMSLLDHADFHAQSATDPTRQYYELAKERVNAADDPMPPRASSTLSAEEKAVLNAWFDAGAPPYTGSCEGDVPPGTDGGLGSPDGGGGIDGGNPPPPPIDVEGLECHRFLAHAPGNKAVPFQVGVQRDAYFTMTFASPWNEPVYGIVIRPIIDNSQVLHHWLLYREPIGGLDGQVQASSGQHISGELVHGWAPGAEALDFSAKGGTVALELPAETYTMEFHYNSADPTAQDASGAEVCFVREPPEHVAGVSWLGYDHGFESYLVAGATGATWSSGNCLFPSDNWVGVCAPLTQEPVHIMAVWPHMHEKGVRMTAVIESPDGSKRPLHDAEFDFDYQRMYQVEEVLMPGERIVTTCEYTAPACSGQATTAEMCYLYTYAYPKGALDDAGPWGHFAHGGSVCLGQ